MKYDEELHGKAIEESMRDRGEEITLEAKIRTFCLLHAAAKVIAEVYADSGKTEITATTEMVTDPTIWKMISDLCKEYEEENGLTRKHPHVNMLRNML